MGTLATRLGRLIGTLHRVTPSIKKPRIKQCNNATCQCELNHEWPDQDQTYSLCEPVRLVDNTLRKALESSVPRCRSAVRAERSIRVIQRNT